MAHATKVKPIRTTLLFTQWCLIIIIVWSIPPAKSLSLQPPRKWIKNTNSVLLHKTHQSNNGSDDETNKRRQLESSVPRACISGYVSESDRDNVIHALQRTGLQLVEEDDDDDNPRFYYTFVKSTGMLKLVNNITPPENESNKNEEVSPPRWIPIISDMENVLNKNGWSFLDPDESDPMSAFDVDAANKEGLYRPKWGNSHDDDIDDDDDGFGLISRLGFDLRPMSTSKILQTNLKDEWSRKVLLDGATDPPQRKRTHNGFDFSSTSFSSSSLSSRRGIFVCAIGGLPLFSSDDLKASTISSGWLSFSRAVSDDHVILVRPDSEYDVDQRVEVVCASSRCHLGHYFGGGKEEEEDDGYCINASALDFIPEEGEDYGYMCCLPISWRCLDSPYSPTAKEYTQSPSSLSAINLIHEICLNSVQTKTIVLGAGCFWHVEYALRRLPGIVSTEVGYAGGKTTTTTSTVVPPTYEEVCTGKTRHAEVVKVNFMPEILDPRILLDCFLSLHDPTKVRAVGKHAIGTGQYRSCIFVVDEEMEPCAREALEDCRKQLNKELSTECRVMDGTLGWFWRAEERHQRHDERRVKEGDESALTMLSPSEWLCVYGRRKDSVMGSSETINDRTELS